MTCLNCGWWEPICKCGESKVINISPDYDFVDINSTGKPIHFHSKRQWKDHLKRHNLTDNFQQSSKGKTYKSIQDKYKPLSHKEIKETMIERFKDTGTYDKLARR